MRRKIITGIIVGLELFWSVFSVFAVWVALVLWGMFFGTFAIYAWEEGEVFRMLFAVGMTLAFPVLYILHLLRKKREREEQKKKLHETFETLGKKPKITRKKGKYRAGNWASKWVAYANDIATPRRSHISIDLPPLPRVSEEREQTRPSRKPETPKVNEQIERNRDDEISHGGADAECRADGG